MQPTFLPWLGYFAMIEAVDHFIFLDDVQFSKQSWQNRNKIKGPDGEVLLSVGVARKPSKPLIRDARLADNGFEQKLLRTLNQCYAGLPFGPQTVALVERGFATCNGSLSDLNVSIIRAICDLVGIDARFHTSSEMELTTGNRSERLVELTRALGGTLYLSPVGAFDYLNEENAFEETEILLQYLNFEHPEYPQPGSAFISHLAAIDTLANVGADATRKLIVSGLGNPLSHGDMQGRV